MPRNPIVREASRARYLATEKGKQTRKRSYVSRQKRLYEQAKSEAGIPLFVECPHCGNSLELQGNSAFVLRKDDVGMTFRPEDYHPNPDRTYKTPEAERRRQLAWYWRNREKVLEREKIKRDRVRGLLAQAGTAS